MCGGGCHGTGRVALHPLLRQVCKCFGFYAAGEIGSEWHQSEEGKRYTKRSGRPNCQGRGWVPDTSLEALLDAFDSNRHLVTIRNTPSATMARWEVEIAGNEPVYDDDFAEALSLALWRAEMARQEKP